MPDDVIGMDDMAAVFAVTDGLGIHRESVRVELSKEDPGAMERATDGAVEITLPISRSTQEFCVQLQEDLLALGYEPSDTVPGDDDDDDAWL